MLSKTEMKMMQKYLETDVEPRIPEIVKCAVGIIIVAAVSLIGAAIGVDTATRAVDLVTLLDPRVLEHLAGIAVTH